MNSTARKEKVEFKRVMKLSDAIGEIAEYLQVDRDYLEKRYDKIANKYKGYNNWSSETEKEFNSLNIDINNADQLKKFYAQTDNYIHELMEYHSTPVKAMMRQRCISIMRQNSVKSVLDYGCGIGQDSIDAARAGFVATACDLPGKTFEFAKWRFENSGMSVKSFDILLNKALPEKYDAITCFEVVMHTTDPVGTIRFLRKYLRSNGLLFFTARFKGYSLALESNRKYNTNFDSIIQDCGFKRIVKERMWGPNNAMGKYLYVYKKVD